MAGKWFDGLFATEKSIKIMGFAWKTIKLYFILLIFL